MKHALLLLAFLISGTIHHQAQTPRQEIKILMEIRPVVMNIVMNEGKKANAPADVLAAVRAVADVYVAHYDAYLKNVYPQVKAEMEERRQLLTQKMQEQSFVKDWERVTGYTWHRGDYHWLLYRAGHETADYRAFGEADVQTFCRIFDRLSKEGISNPAELYRKGIMEYLDVVI